MPAPGSLLAAISEFVETHKKDERYHGAIESMSGVLEKLKALDPAEGDSAGRLAAKQAASPDPTPEVREAPKSDAEPKTFAEAKAAAMEMVSKATAA